MVPTLAATAATIACSKGYADDLFPFVFQKVNSLTEQFTQHDLGNFSRLGADLAIAGVAGLACWSILKVIAEKKRLDSIKLYTELLKNEATLLENKKKQKDPYYDIFAKESAKRRAGYQKIIQNLQISSINSPEKWQAMAGLRF